MKQELLVYFIVGLALFDVCRRIFKSTLALPLAQYLLRRGKVKWAMRVRGWS